MPALIALALIAAAFAACLAPLVAADSTFEGGDGSDALAAERDRLLDAIRDADMDLAMGKISSDDHAQLRSSLEARAVAILADLDAQDSGPGREA